MNTIMNKDIPLIDFEWEGDEVLGYRCAIKEVYQMPWFIEKVGLANWLEHRTVAKHRSNVEKLLKLMGIRNTKGILDFCKGLSLTDTLWINEDGKHCWKDVNLFENEFDEVIQRIAFDGGLHGREFSTTSPEFVTDGAFAKCWVREDDNIVYLYKQGSEGAANTGKEIYSEMYATQLIKKMGYTAVPYDIVKFHERLVSRCPLMTSQQSMLLPFSSIAVKKDLAELREFSEKYNCKDKLAEYLILDALIMNEDRHLGNIGIFCDADTFEIQGFSPIYDNGVSLLCYYHTDPRIKFETMEEYSRLRGPRVYDDFISGARAIASKEQLSDLVKLKDFKFTPQGKYNLPQERLDCINEIFQMQLEKLIEGVE